MAHVPTRMPLYVHESLLRPAPPLAAAAPPLAAAAVAGPAAPLELGLANLRRDAPLDAGAFKTVWTGSYLGGPVAIATLRVGVRMDAEVAMLARVSQHPCIVRLIGVCDDDQGCQVVVTELAMGSLNRWIECSRGVAAPGSAFADAPALSGAHRVRVAQQTAAGMAYLAQAGVVHRDLAARNVLVKSVHPLHVAVTDFGLSVATTEAAPYARGTIRTVGGGMVAPLRWMAPETMRRQKVWSEASDVWSFGVVLWELFATDEYPFIELDDAEIFAFLTLPGADGAPQRLAQPAGCPDSAYARMRQCWSADAAARPTFAALVDALQGEQW